MNLIEWNTNLSLCKIFHLHLKTSMNFTKLTCRGKLMKIELNSFPSISTCGNIGIISYLCTNQFSNWIWQCLRITLHGLDFMVSHIYCWKRKGVDKFIVEGQHNPIWGHDQEYMHRVHHYHQLQLWILYCGVHFSFSIFHIFLVHLLSPFLVAFEATK